MNYIFRSRANYARQEKRKCLRHLSLRWFKKQAHREERRNGRAMIMQELV